MATYLNKSHEHVARRLRLLDDPEVESAVREGLVGLSVGYELAGLADRTRRQALLARARAGERIALRDIAPAAPEEVSQFVTDPSSGSTTGASDTPGGEQPSSGASARSETEVAGLSHIVTEHEHRSSVHRPSQGVIEGRGPGDVRIGATERSGPRSLPYAGAEPQGSAASHRTSVEDTVLVGMQFSTEVRARAGAIAGEIRSFMRDVDLPDPRDLATLEAAAALVEWIATPLPEE
jgi:hypothetical protein